MRAYASRTGTRRNLEALRRAGWSLLISAVGVHRHEGFDYAIDNGAWSAHQAQESWESPAYRGKFEELLGTHGAGADWIARPDIVEGGRASLERSLQWKERLERTIPQAPLLIPVQDGMTPALLEPHLHARCGVFVGGSTRFKETTMHLWGQVCRAQGAWLHVGRVNTRRRIRLCQMARADSFDGTSVTRFASTLETLEAERAQLVLTFETH